jgi:hypothetical protein
MKLADLFESKKLRWAVGPNFSHAEYKPAQTNKDRTVVWARISDIMSHTRRDYALDLNHPRGGAHAVGARVDKAKQHWAAGGYMDPSEIHVDGNTITFTNGRHRLVAAHQLGEEYAPVVVALDELDDLEKIVDTREY